MTDYLAWMRLGALVMLALALMYVRMRHPRPDPSAFYKTIIDAFTQANEARERRDSRS